MSDDDYSSKYDEFIKFGKVSPKNVNIRKELRVKHLMTTNVFTLKETDTLRSVEIIMEFRKIRHVPVVDKDRRLKGLVTHRDFLALNFSTMSVVPKEKQKEVSRAVKVADIMHTELFCVAPDTTILKAAEYMYSKKYGCLPVVQDEILVGILSAHDFVKFFVEWDLFL